MPALTAPVEGDPFLQPVEGDPFSAAGIVGDVGAAQQKLLGQEAQRRATVEQFARRWTLPGRVAAGVQTETPGVMTEEDAYRQNQLEAEAQGWGPEQAATMLRTGVPFAQPGSLGAAGGGIKAYHGSPHDFEKFDVSKIGTGEGAQAYGHGLYFAEHPDTAQAYRDMLTTRRDPTYRVGDEELTGPALSRKMTRELGYSTDYASRSVLRDLAAGLPFEDIRKGNPQSFHKVVDWLEKNNAKFVEPEAPSGRMYEVNINADPEHFLDWDKPLSEQHPKVQEAFGGVGGDLRTSELADLRAPETAERLREAGIPGIKYLDQGSRGAEKQTHNYVVFHHDLIDILKKYGLAGLVAAGASHFKTQPHDGDPFAESQ